jgi:hypothetical protein
MWLVFKGVPLRDIEEHWSIDDLQIALEYQGEIDHAQKEADKAAGIRRKRG